MALTQFLSKLFGNKSQRDLKEVTPYVTKIKEIYPTIEKLSNDELRARTDALRKRIADYTQDKVDEIEKLKEGLEELNLEQRDEAWKHIDKLREEILDKNEEILDEILPEAFAIMKDTARRFKENEHIIVQANEQDKKLAATKDFVTIEGDQAIYQNHWMAGGNEIIWDMVHYDVQLIGGVVLHKGKIAEMATGEGKTLVATLPVFLNALTGRGVHVVTVNDYLSKRDAEWMGPLYMFHGLTVDCIDNHKPNSDGRRTAYNADITFGTNNEFGFDYLRDNMAVSPSDLVQRKHNYAIVDEVDSVLIDDARTPLIISGPTPKGEEQLFETYLPNVEKVVEAQRKLCSQLLIDAKKKMQSTDKKEQEEGALLLFRSYKGLPKNKALIKYLSEPGVKSTMLKTEELYMQDNMRQMHIVTDPLYFVIDEKMQSINLTDLGQEFLSRGTQDSQFFVLPDIASQLSMLDAEELTPEAKAEKRDEIVTDYAIKSERVHTVNQLFKAYALFEKDDQYVVIDNKVMIVDEQTGRIMEGRRYSDGLHQAIEAKERVKVEAATQTFATITLQNYFRMYHKLAGMTGTAETEAGEFWDIYKLDVVVIPTNKPVIRKDMNDRIYKTAREKYKAVIDEIESLINEGRPVLVGTTSVEISELLSKMLSLKKIPHNVLNAKLHQKEAEIVAEAGKKGTVTIATNMAGRGTDIKLSQEVRDAGGLAIIGTERHESRRVDRQLRGRSGRQGDPGSSVFFISLEDHLMRLFASDRIASLMDRMGFKEGDVLENKMLSKNVERAQKKVEENNFGIRKRLLEYDDVMNSQREVIYTRRRHALMGERIGLDTLNTLYDVTEQIVEKNKEADDFETFKHEMLSTLAVESSISEEQFHKTKADVLAADVFDQVYASYKRKLDTIAAIAYPIIHQVREQRGDKFERIIVPITDGKRAYNIATNLKESDETEGRALLKDIEKSISLYTIDEAWKEHLREMDELRNSVQSAAYENKDPLLIYKLESYELFKNMVETMNRKTASILMRAHIPMPDQGSGEQNVNVREAAPERRSDMSRYSTRKDDVLEESRQMQRTASQSAGGNAPVKQQPIIAEKKIGRNDPCPCGSGKKYKNCHGKDL